MSRQKNHYFRYKLFRFKLHVYMIMTLMAISGMSISCRVSPANQPLPTASDGQMQVTPAAELENRTEPVVITFACPGWIKSEIKEVAGSFEDSYPDIRVHLVTVEEIAQFGQDVNYEDTIRQIVSSADAAQWLPTPLASREGMLLNLTPYIEADNSFDTNDIYAPMLDSVQWDGGTWALPSKGTLALLYYDKNAFDDATLEYPTLDWTLDDFLTAAQLLTLRDGETVTQYGFVDYANGLLSASVTSEFSEARNDTGEFTVPQLNNPVISSAMKWYVDLALEYGVMPNPQTLSSSENGRYQALHSLVHGDIADKESNGIAAMWTDLLSNYTMNTDLHGRVGIAPIPGRNHALPFSLWESYIVSAGTQHPEETWRWLTYLIQHPISGSPAVANDIPAYRPIAEQSYYWVRWTDEEKAVIKYSLENAMILKVKDVAGAVRSAANAVFSGETVDAALLVAQESVTESYQTLMQAQPIHIAVSTPAPEKPGVSTITFATTHTSEYEQLTSVFHETYPDIRVNIIRPDAGEHYDCFVSHRDVTQDHGRDGILNVQPLIEAEADFPLSEFHPRSLEALQYKGDLWGIPSQATAIAIFYNRDLFDAMDLAYPKPGWTIEDFQETATKLTQSTDTTKQYGYAPIANEFDINLFLDLQNVELWDEQDNPQFDTPRVVNTVQWYVDLVRLHRVFSQEFGSNRQTLIRQGRVGMWLDVAGEPYEIASRGPRNASIGIVPLPVGETAKSGLDYEALFISSDTQNIDACWQWTKLISQHMTPIYGIPARTAHFNSSGYQTQIGMELINAYRAMLDYAPLTQYTPAQLSFLRKYFDPALEQILGGDSVTKTLSEVQNNARDQR